MLFHWRAALGTAVLGCFFLSCDTGVDSDTALLLLRKARVLSERPLVLRTVGVLVPIFIALVASHIGRRPFCRSVPTSSGNKICNWSTSKNRPWEPSSRAS